MSFTDADVRAWAESPWFDYDHTRSIRRELRCRHGYSRSQGPEYKADLLNQVEFLDACCFYHEEKLYGGAEAA